MPASRLSSSTPPRCAVSRRNMPDCSNCGPSFDRGLMIVGVPSNDFGGQEPGSASDIAATAQHQYGVTLPIAAKTVVKGPNAHPFYKWAADLRPKDVPRWNFHKYLIGRDGNIAEVFPESVEPKDTRVKTAIARALAAA